MLALRAQTGFRRKKNYAMLSWSAWASLHKTITGTMQKQPPEVFLKTSQYLQEKHLCWILFLIKLQPFRASTLLKKNSDKVVFL